MLSTSSSTWPPETLCGFLILLRKQFSITNPNDSYWELILFRVPKYYKIDYPEIAREKLAIKDMEKLITRLDELEQYIHITKEYKNTNLYQIS